MAVDTELWERVYQRDEGRCVAPLLDPTAGPCTDHWGNPIRKNSLRQYPRQTLTFAHIKMAPGGPRVDDERHGVMACWGHHVFGSMWITSKPALGKVRAYLRRKYGYDYE